MTEVRHTPGCEVLSVHVNEAMCRQYEGLDLLKVVTDQSKGNKGKLAMTVDIACCPAASLRLIIAALHGLCH